MASHDTLGNITAETYGSASGESQTLQFVYAPNGHNGELLQSVKLVNHAGTTIQEVDYTYYDGVTDTDNGAAGDLKSVSVSVDSGNGQGPVQVGGDYYRYQVSGALKSDPAAAVFDAKKDLLTDVVSGEQFAIAEQQIGGGGGSGKPVDVSQWGTYSHAQLGSFDTVGFAYNASGQAVTQGIQGAGASSSNQLSALGTYSYAYPGTPGAHGVGINVWMYETAVTDPAGNVTTYFSNGVGEVMLSSFDDMSDANTDLQGDFWNTYYHYDNAGQLVVMAEPSAVTNGFDSNYTDLVNFNHEADTAANTDEYVSADAGLLETTTYNGTDGSGGAAPGYVEADYVQEGADGTAEEQDSYTYQSQSGPEGAEIWWVSASVVYAGDNGTAPRETQYHDDFAGGKFQLSDEITTLPVVSTDQNGPGTTDTVETDFGNFGQVMDTIDAGGFKTTYGYDDATGMVTNTDQEVGGGVSDVMTSETVDNLGRPLTMTDGDGNTTTIEYMDSLTMSMVRTTLPATAGSNSTAPPVQVVVDNYGKGLLENYTVSASSDRILSLTADLLDDAGRTVAVRQYFNTQDADAETRLKESTLANQLPASGYYYSTTTYNAMGLVASETDAVGNVTNTTYDALGRAFQMTLNGADLYKYEYDNDQVGDGVLTQEMTYPGNGESPRVTRYYVDWRDRTVASDDGIRIVYSDLDNLGEVTSTSVYQSVAGGGVGAAVDGAPAKPAGSLLRAQSDQFYDSRGDLYQQVVDSVDPSSGTIGTATLVTNEFHDSRGDVVAEQDPSGLWTKTVYDGLGRITATYQTDGAGGAEVGASNPVIGDTVFSSTVTTYDGASNVIYTVATQYAYTSDGTPVAVDSSGDTSEVTRTAYYYDDADRLTGQATGAVSAPAPGDQPPARSSSVLVTSYQYGEGAVDSEGSSQTITTDPKGVETLDIYDALGRLVSETLAYSSDGVIDANHNDGTAYTYDGLDREVTVTNVISIDSSQNPVTRYTYNGLYLSMILYPGAPSLGQGSLAAFQEIYSYDQLGEVTYERDRGGASHNYQYDAEGHVVSDHVYFSPNDTTTDQRVNELDYAYDALGDMTLATSKGAGGTLNQVQMVYDGFDQLVQEYEADTGAVDIATTPSVAYTRDASHGDRITVLTYPNGRQLTYVYSGLDASISRVSGISEGGVSLDAYTYLGIGTVIGRNESQSGLTLTIQLNSLGQLSDIDWTDSGVDVEHLAYGYDADGNTLWRDDLTATAAAHPEFGESYTYNDLGYQTSFNRGTLSGTGTSRMVTTPVTPPTQTLSPNGLGNEFPDAGDPSEPGALSYDANGAATSIQVDPDEDTGVANLGYDAWDRVTLLQSNDDIEQFTYDALGRRIIAKYFAPTFTGFPDPNTATPLATSYVSYYDASGHDLEDRLLGTGATATQNVWTAAGPSELVLEDRDADGNAGTGNYGVAGSGLETRYYVITDAQGSSVAITDVLGNVQERYVYGFGGTVQALHVDYSPYMVDGLVETAPQLGFGYLYQGRLFHEASDGFGLYETAGNGTWYDPEHAANVQPDYQAQMGSRAVYDPGISSAWGYVAAGAAVGVGAAVTYLTAGVATPWIAGLGMAEAGTLTFGGTVAVNSIAGFSGTSAMAGLVSYGGGGTPGEIARATLYGGGIGLVTGGVAGALQFAFLGGIPVGLARETAAFGQSYATSEEWAALLAGRYGAENVSGGSLILRNAIYGNVLANQTVMQAISQSGGLDALEAAEMEAAGAGAVGQIPYGGSDLSLLAQEFRQGVGIAFGRNISVVEFMTPNGLNTVVAASARGVGHAERIAGSSVLEMVDASAVTRIYSELQPCNLPGGYCAPWISRTFPGASVTWSFEYGISEESRQAGLLALRQAVSGE